MLTYRTNNSGTLHAAYSQHVRVGYVEQRPGDRWLWQLSLLRPEGGAYMGREDSEEAAKDELHKSYLHWIASAGLQLKETANDQRRDHREHEAGTDAAGTRGKTGRGGTVGGNKRGTRARREPAA